MTLQGPCWLLPPDAEPVRLDAGDVLFLPRGSGHILADTPDAVVAGQACHPDDPGFTEAVAEASDSVDPSGLAGPVTVVLCGAYRLDPSRGHPLLRTLPDLIHLRARPGRHPALRAAVELLAAEMGERRPGTTMLLPALMDALLLYILRIWFTEQPAHPDTGSWAAALNDPPVAAPSTPSTGTRRRRGRWRSSPRRPGSPGRPSPGASPC